MKNGTYTGKKKEIKMNAQAKKQASLPSAGSGQASASPGTADAPQGAESASGAKRSKRVTPKIAKQAALAIEAAGTLLAKAVDAMDAARRLPAPEREAEQKRKWREIGLILDEHATAMLIFLAFCGSHVRGGGME